MTTYTIIRVIVRSPRGIDGIPYVEDREREVDAYIYGRHFLLGAEGIDDLRDAVALFYLVESHYVNQVIPRLASGLFTARVATPEEQYALGL